MNMLIFKAIDLVFRFIEIAIFIRIVVSWLPVPRDNQFMRVLYQVTEPILAPIRSMLDKSPLGKNIMRMVDLSPLVAILLIGFIENIIGRILMSNFFIF